LFEYQSQFAKCLEENDPSVTGLNISKQYLAIGALFGQAKFEETQKYLELIGTRPLSIDDINGFKQTTPQALAAHMHRSETKTSIDIAPMMEILCKIETDISRQMHKDNLPQIIKEISDAASVHSETLEKEHGDILRTLYAKMIPKTIDTKEVREAVSPAPSPTPPPYHHVSWMKKIFGRVRRDRDSTPPYHRVSWFKKIFGRVRRDSSSRTP
jgi:hypothetical protein